MRPAVGRLGGDPLAAPWAHRSGMEVGSPRGGPWGGDGEGIHHEPSESPLAQQGIDAIALPKREGQGRWDREADALALRRVVEIDVAPLDGGHEEPTFQLFLGGRAFAFPLPHGAGVGVRIPIVEIPAGPPLLREGPKAPGEAVEAPQLLRRLLEGREDLPARLPIDRALCDEGANTTGEHPRHLFQSAHGQGDLGDQMVGNELPGQGSGEGPDGQAGHAPSCDLLHGDPMSPGEKIRELVEEPFAPFSFREVGRQEAGKHIGRHLCRLLLSIGNGLGPADDPEGIHAQSPGMKLHPSIPTYWGDTAPGASTFPTLEADLQVDVAVVGAGIAGLTAAFLLTRAGRSVAVLESGTVAGGESGRTSAHLTAIQDLRFKEMASRFGLDATKLMAQHGMNAIEWVQRVVHDEGIDCQFERLPGYLFTEDESERRHLEAEALAARRAGLLASWVDEVPLPWGVAGAVRFEDQAAFHPVEYLQGLANAIVRHGGKIFENSRVRSVDDGKPCRVATDRARVTARDVIVATDSPISSRFFLHNKLSPMRTYLVEGKLSSPLPGLFWDTDDPYHYIRTVEGPEGTVVLVGGGDHRVGTVEDTASRIEDLAGWAGSRLGLSIDRAWSGQVNEPADGLPYVGRNAISFHVYVATGFSGTGLVNGTLAGTLLSQTLLGHHHPLSKLLAATRVRPLRAGKEVISHGVESAWHFFKDRIVPAEVDSVARVPPGEGRIVRLGGEPVAVHRDDAGQLHAVSPVCTHLGCHVHWNAGERSWDCPCHGSRYEPDGTVLHGPAVKALARKEIPVEQRLPWDGEGERRQSIPEEGGGEPAPGP